MSSETVKPINSTLITVLLLMTTILYILVKKKKSGNIGNVSNFNTNELAQKISSRIKVQCPSNNNQNQNKDLKEILQKLDDINKNIDIENILKKIKSQSTKLSSIDIDKISAKLASQKIDFDVSELNIPAPVVNINTDELSSKIIPIVNVDIDSIVNKLPYSIIASNITPTVNIDTAALASQLPTPTVEFDLSKLNVPTPSVTLDTDELASKINPTVDIDSIVNKLPYSTIASNITPTVNIDTAALASQLPTPTVEFDLSKLNVPTPSVTMDTDELASKITPTVDIDSIVNKLPYNTIASNITPTVNIDTAALASQLPTPTVEFDLSKLDVPTPSVTMDTDELASKIIPTVDIDSIVNKLPYSTIASNITPTVNIDTDALANQLPTPVVNLDTAALSSQIVPSVNIEDIISKLPYDTIASKIVPITNIDTTDFKDYIKNLIKNSRKCIGMDFPRSRHITFHTNASGFDSENMRLYNLCDSDEYISLNGTMGIGTLNNGEKYIYGLTDSNFMLPTMLKANGTFIHVTRYYNSANKNRIYTGYNVNWLSGFHSSKSGVAYHGKWITRGHQTGEPLLICVDQKDSFFVNGVLKNNVPGVYKDVDINVGINIGNPGNKYSEKSNFVICEIIMYDIPLTYNEISTITKKLNAKYNIYDEIEQEKKFMIFKF
jgi:hypothetical protein